MKYHRVFFFRRIPLGPIPMLFVKTALFSSSSEENRIPFQFTKLVWYCWTRLGQRGEVGSGEEEQKTSKAHQPNKREELWLWYFTIRQYFLGKQIKNFLNNFYGQKVSISVTYQKQVIINTATSLNSYLNTGTKIRLFCLFFIDLVVLIHFFFFLKGFSVVLWSGSSCIWT